MQRGRIPSGLILSLSPCVFRPARAHRLHLVEGNQKRLELMGGRGSKYRKTAPAPGASDQNEIEGQLIEVKERVGSQDERQLQIQDVVKEAPSATSRPSRERRESIQRQERAAKQEALPSLPPAPLGSTAGLPTEVASLWGEDHHVENSKVFTSVGGGRAKATMNVESQNAVFTSASMNSAQMLRVITNDGGYRRRRPPMNCPGKKSTKVVNFHGHFRAPTVALSEGARVVEQLDMEMGANGNLGGGMAVTREPLTLRVGVVPFKPLARGVFFEVVVENCDNGAKWGDGMGIGITSEDPDAWPKGRPVPRYGKSLVQAWMGGYDGSWVFMRCTKWMRPVGRQPQWHPGKTLKIGDTVSVAVVQQERDSRTEPVPLEGDAVQMHNRADLFVFVNNVMVAFETGDKLPSLPDPTKVALWGVVDVDGAVLKVRASSRNALLRLEGDVSGRFKCYG